MNPIKWLWKLIKTFIASVADDVKWFFIIINKLSNNEPLINPEKKAYLVAEFKKMTIASYFKDNWIWISCIIFALLMGWIFAAKYYEIQCNNLIIETYVNPAIREAAENTYVNFQNISIPK